MEQYKAIPQGYMSVGEAAKKMGVTVRTLQYYDREGLLSPSAESEGGRRLYSGKDIIQLHQILSMKQLGFSLNDIKNHLLFLDTPDDVARALAKQAAAIREKLEILSESLRKIEMLHSEVLQMQSVDFKKYADIIVNLQMKNEFYWKIKHIDDQVLAHFRTRFDQESGPAMMEVCKSLNEQATQLKKNGVAPESEKGQAFAKAYWDMLMEFTGGDMRLLSKLMETKQYDGLDNQEKLQQEAVHGFIESALGAYFTALGYNPFEEGVK